MIKRLNTQGCLEYRRQRFFVCEALAGERVGIEDIDHHLLISYRHMYVREIDTDTGKTRPLIMHTQEL